MGDQLDNFDDFLRDKLKENELPYKDVYWHQMEKTLGQASSVASTTSAIGKSIVSKLVISFSAISLTAGSVYYYISGSKDANHKHLEEVQLKEANKIEQNNTSLSNIYNNGKNTNNKKPLSNTIAANINSGQASLSNQESSSTFTSKEVHVNPIQTSVSEEVSNVKRKPGKDSIPSSKGINTKISSSESLTAKISNLESQDQLTAIESKILEKPQQYLTSVNPGKMGKGLIGSSILDKDSTIIDSDKAITPVVDSVMGVSSIEIKHSAAIDNIQVDLKNKQFYSLQIIVGLNGMKGFSNSSAEASYSTGFLAGLGFEHRLNEQASLLVDIIYLRTGGHQLSVMREQKSYFIGEEITAVSIITKKIDFVYFPISFKQKLGKRQSITGGLSFLMPVNTYSDKTETSTTISSSKEITEKNSTGYNWQGLQYLNYGLMAGYEFNFSSNIILGLRISQGINNITKEDWFLNSGKNRMTDLQLFVKLGVF